MRTLPISCWSLIITLSCVMSSNAIASPLESIEAVSFDYANYRTYKSIGGSIETHVPIYPAQDRNFFTARVSGARLQQDIGPSYDNLAVELGLKSKITSVTSLAVAGSYDWYLGTDDYSTAAAHVRFWQAFQPDHAPVVPFIRLHGKLQSIEPVAASPARQSESYRLLVFEAIGGIEIRIRKDFRWVFEGGRSQSTAISNAGPDLADGWVGRIAMRYDWF